MNGEGFWRLMSNVCRYIPTNVRCDLLPWFLFFSGSSLSPLFYLTAECCTSGLHI